jgi:hypothetical protein
VGRALDGGTSRTASRSAARVSLAPPARQPRSNVRSRIVVVEPGADNAPCAATLEQTMVVAPTSGEDALALARRAIPRIACVQSGSTEGEIVVCLGARSDPQTLAARRILGTAVLAEARATRRRCELIFVGNAGDYELQHRLWELVELLVHEPGSAFVPIRLRFEVAE